MFTNWLSVLALVPQLNEGALTVSIDCAADNTMYVSSFADISNGKGWHMFTGVNGVNQPRRALVLFDVAGALPVGATVLEAELRCRVSKVSDLLPREIELHRLLASFGESTSNAAGEEGIGAFATDGDATWDHRFYPNQFWATAGGDFVPSPSSTTTVTDVGPAIFASTAALIADVQDMLVAPANNHGWLLLGNEIEEGTAKRFDSRENPDLSARPILVVTYLPKSACGTFLPPISSQRVGVPPNPLALAPLSESPAVIGQAFGLTVDHASFAPDAILDLLGIAALPDNLATSFGTLLCSLGGPIVVVAKDPSAQFLLPLQNKCSLVGASFCTQVASFSPSGAIALTNAVDFVVGG